MENKEIDGLEYEIAKEAIEELAGQGSSIYDTLDRKNLVEYVYKSHNLNMGKTRANKLDKSDPILNLTRARIYRELELTEAAAHFYQIASAQLSTPIAEKISQILESMPEAMAA